MPTVEHRVAMHAALADPVRLGIVDDLMVSDRAPKEIAGRLGLSSNLLAHHLDVLEAAGLVQRLVSAGDQRRKYVRLVPSALCALHATRPTRPRSVLFVCSHNSARSQLAVAVWRARAGGTGTVSSAGTHPATEVHPGAVAAARRAGLSLDGATPRPLGRVRAGTQVITVCDRAHEELSATDDWWHWSLPDPVAAGTPAAFDDVVHELDHRISALLHPEGTPPS